MDTSYKPSLKSTLSLTPIVHRSPNKKTAKTSGGFTMKKPDVNIHPSNDVGSHLRISPATRYDVKDGFGETGPQVIKEFPRLLAAEHLFIPPPEPEVIPMIDEEIQSEPMLFKKELESIQDYQEWLNGTVEPFLKDLKMVILQAKPDNLNDFVLQYVNSLETKSEKPVTIDLEEYKFNLRQEKKKKEQEEKKLKLLADKESAKQSKK